MEKIALLFLILISTVLVSGCVTQETWDGGAQATTTSQPGTTPTTTTTIKTISDADLNFTTPELLIRKKTFITDSFKVYINDSFLKIIDPNGTRGIYNSSMASAKKAFGIWENGTGLVHFDFVDSSGNDTIEMRWSGNPGGLDGGLMSVGAVATAQPYFENCSNYLFVKGGLIELSVLTGSQELSVATHEVGHILDLGDVGTSGSMMNTWYEENPPSEDIIKTLISTGINDTLKLIIRPSYDCGSGVIDICPASSVLCNGKCWVDCPEGQMFNCTARGPECSYIISETCSANHIYCDHTCWRNCDEGWSFYCDSETSVCLKSGECPYNTVSCYGKCHEKCSTNSTFYCYPDKAYCE